MLIQKPPSRVTGAGQSPCSQATWCDKKAWARVTSNKSHNLLKLGFPAHKMVGVIGNCPGVWSGSGAMTEVKYLELKRHSGCL